jgi:hypothetical protein
MTEYLVRYGHHRSRRTKSVATAYRLWLYPPQYAGGDDTVEVVRERESEPRRIIIHGKRGIMRGRLSEGEKYELDRAGYRID